MRAIALAMGQREPESKRSRDQSPKPQQAPARGTRPLEILLAEDSPDNRLLIKQYLQKLAYTLVDARRER